MKYFDYTATTPVDKEVLDTYIKTTNNFFANSNSCSSLTKRVFRFAKTLTNGAFQPYCFILIYMT
mgnify:CR=1 FL=1